jgi:Sec-independent protein translocase protein TatA
MNWTVLLKEEQDIMPALGWPELLILLAIVALIFGVGRLPEIGNNG